MTANVGLRGAGDADAALLPLHVALPQGRHARGLDVTTRRRAQVALRPVDDRRSTARTASSSASGLAGGEWIVAAGVHKLQPGQAVRPYEGGARRPRRPRGAAAPR